MAISIRQTKHLDECDFDRIDYTNKAVMALLNHKLIVRADDVYESTQQLEDVFTWLTENCTDFYSVRGPETDKLTIKYYIYFINEDGMTLFATSFPRDSDEE